MNNHGCSVRCPSTTIRVPPTSLISRSLALSVRPNSDAPGTVFEYNNFLPLLVGMILERATRRPVSQYLQEKIWQPLGMEYGASWSLDSQASGFEKMAMGLNGITLSFLAIKSALEFAGAASLAGHRGHLILQTVGPPTSSWRYRRRGAAPRRRVCRSRMDRRNGLGPLNYRRAETSWHPSRNSPTAAVTRSRSSLSDLATLPLRIAVRTGPLTTA